MLLKNSLIFYSPTDFIKMFLFDLNNIQNLQLISEIFFINFQV